MAKMYPQNPETFKSKGEEKAFRFIEKYLPDEYTVYFNYRVNGQEFDIAILVPGMGVVMLEIKGHYECNILNIIDNENIQLVNGEIIKSPWKQADRYRWNLLNKIKEKFDDINVPVVPMVCYPYISKETFYEKRLDIVSDEKETFLSDDFEDKILFINKVEDSLKSVMTLKHIKNVTNISLKKVRSLFEVMDSNIEEEIKLDKCYSVLKYIGMKDNYKVEVTSLINLWTKGTKIILLSESDEVLKFVRVSLKNKMTELYINQINDFNIEENGESIYNFNLYKIPGAIKKSLTIIDGDIQVINERYKILSRIDEVTSFNLNQYKIEHAPIEQDIVIKAGAGTGKTYSMISRINYLIYRHKLNEENLNDSIILITFTNEAAKNMKRRLQLSLKNRYILTKEFSALQMIECVENMNICTIHSLTKKILKKFSVKLGLGNDLKIITGAYELNKIIDETTNKYISDNDRLQNNKLLEDLRLYDLKNRINKILEKLSNKNLDINNDCLDFGEINDDVGYKNEIANMILNIAKESEFLIKENSNKNNNIRLNDLIIKLKELINEHKEELEKEVSYLKYLFIDEYQDTDDVQIELMKNFQDILGFNFLVVGDIKQCIYRFRGAEDKAFDILQENRKEFLEYSLNKNYRSDKELLKEFHDIFKVWNDKYKSLEYKVDDELIGVKEFNNSSKLVKRISISSDEEIERKLVEQIRLLKNQLSNKETITILVRENKQIEKIKRMINKPEYSDIYIETDIGGDLYKIKPTLDLYKLVLALKYNKDPKYLFNLYTTEYVDRYVSKSDIYNNRNDKKGLVNIFNEKYCIENWNEYIDRLKIEPIMKVIRDIISKTKPWNNYASEFENEIAKIRSINYYKVNLEQLIEKIVTTYDNDYLTLNKLEQFLKIMITTKQNEESRGTHFEIDEENLTEPRIQCMTVHKSKGLEFDVIIIPYCDLNIEDPKKKGYVDIITRKNKIGYYIQLPKITGASSNKLGHYNSQVIQNNYYMEERKTEIEDRKKEETRILYVAMTRAIQQFIYFDNNKVNNMSWKKLIKGD